MADDSIPLQPEREYDLPTGPHEGRAAALRVPCSCSDFPPQLVRGETPDTTLIELEPPLFQRASALAPGAPLAWSMPTLPARRRSR